MNGDQYLPGDCHECRDSVCMGCDGEDGLTEDAALLLLEYETHGTGFPGLEDLPLPAPTGWGGHAGSSHPNCPYSVG